MRIVIVAVGKIKERGIREAVDDYLGRTRRYVAVDEVELKDAPPPRVHAAIVAKLPEAAHVVALDVGGRAMSSEAFSKWVERNGSQGKGVVAFLIGGADGLPPETVRLAQERLSLSTMTLPHRLARLLLAEQIYRAFTLLRGEPYPR